MAIFLTICAVLAVVYAAGFLVIWFKIGPSDPSSWLFDAGQLRCFFAVTWPYWALKALNEYIENG